MLDGPRRFLASWALLLLRSFFVFSICLQQLVTVIATYGPFMSMLLSSWICNYFPALFFMDNCYFRNWNVLCWNIRGLNSGDKQLDLSNAINASGCSVLCLQETKKPMIDHAFIKSCCPRRFDQFSFVPSNGFWDIIHSSLFLIGL